MSENAEVLRRKFIARLIVEGVLVFVINEVDDDLGELLDQEAREAVNKYKEENE